LGGIGAWAHIRQNVRTQPYNYVVEVVLITPFLSTLTYVTYTYLRVLALNLRS